MLNQEAESKRSIRTLKNFDRMRQEHQQVTKNLNDMSQIKAKSKGGELPLDLKPQENLDGKRQERQEPRKTLDNLRQQIENQKDRANSIKGKKNTKNRDSRMKRQRTNTP